MPAKRLRDPWEEPVRQIVSDHPSWGRREVREALTQHAAERGMSPVDVPSESTVGRIMADFRKAGPAQRRNYERFRWPESLGTDDMPWEAGRALLDLLAYHDAHEMPRPPNRLARWFWRVTLAAPDAPIEERLSVSIGLASGESVEDSVPLSWEERFLAYAPWKDELNRDLLMLSLLRSWLLGQEFLSPREGEAEVVESTFSDNLLELGRALFGSLSAAGEADIQREITEFERMLEAFKKSNPEEFAVFEQRQAERKQSRQEATFLSQFKPRAGTEGEDWRRRAANQGKRAFNMEGEDEQTGK